MRLIKYPTIDFWHDHEQCCKLLDFGKRSMIEKLQIDELACIAVPFTEKIIEYCAAINKTIATWTWYG
jgi:hypothetical protein